MFTVELVGDRKIGDTLCCMPFLLALKDRVGERVALMGNYSRLVEPLFDGSSIVFREDAENPDLLVNVREAFDCANINHLHMAAAHFRLHKLPPPPSPMTLPFVEGQAKSRPDIAIAPFTASDEAFTKLWPMERWVALIEGLRLSHGIGEVAVLGGPQDDMSVFEKSGCILLRDLPLPDAYATMRQAKLFLSVDSGLSHIAHFGGIGSHLLIYPNHVSRYLASNPRGHSLICRAGDLTVEEMMREIEFRYSDVLGSMDVKPGPAMGFDGTLRFIEPVAARTRARNLLAAAVEWDGYVELAAGDSTPPATPIVILDDRPGAEWQRLHYWKKPAPSVDGIGAYFLHDVTLWEPGLIAIEDRFLEVEPTSFRVAQERLARRRSGPREEIVVKEPVLLADGPGFDIWGHWLVEFVPRIAIAQRLLDGMFEDMRIPLHAGTPSWVETLLFELFGISRSRIFYYESKHSRLLLKRAIIPTFCFTKEYTFHPFIRAFYNDLRVQSGRADRRLCISRANAIFSDMRPFAHREAFEAMAQENGFEIVVPQEMPISDQIRMFSEARIIVGEYGSALHNSVFAPPGAIVGAIGQWNAIQMRLGEVLGQQSVFLTRGCHWPDADSPMRIETSLTDLASFFDVLNAMGAPVATENGK